jgi:hypothetical protein
MAGPLVDVIAESPYLVTCDVLLLIIIWLNGVIVVVI